MLRRSVLRAQVHSHTYDTTDIPAAKFTYDLSPIQILVSEKRRAWCARGFHLLPALISQGLLGS